MAEEAQDLQIRAAKALELARARLRGDRVPEAPGVVGTAIVLAVAIVNLGLALLTAIVEFLGALAGKNCRQGTAEVQRAVYAVAGAVAGTAEAARKKLH